MSIFEAFLATLFWVTYISLWVTLAGTLIKTVIDCAWVEDWPRKAKMKIMIASVIMILLITHGVWYMGNTPA